MTENPPQNPPADGPFVTIIIDHYNSKPYVGSAIDSALSQDYPHREILVVDDGSTDGSKDVILSYGDRITAIFKENGGQNSCLNTGVAHSKGEILFFLDGDDCFYPHKISEMVKLYQKIDFSNKKILLFHRVESKDDRGEVTLLQPKTFRDIHRKKLKTTFGRLSTPKEAYQYACRYGFLSFLASPTCGTSMTAELAKEVFPLPESAPILSDSFFVLASLLLGDVYGTSQVLGLFRLHGGNATYWSQNLIYSREFVRTRDDFLNQKLKDQGKKPVISFYTSRHALRYYRKHLGSPRGLFVLAWQVARRYLSWDTFYFALKTIWLALRMTLVNSFKSSVKKAGSP